MAAARGALQWAAKRSSTLSGNRRCVFWGNRIPFPGTKHTVKLIGKSVVVLRLWSVGTCGHQKSQLRRPESTEAAGARNVPARTGVVAPWCSQLLGVWLGADHWGLS